MTDKSKKIPPLRTDLQLQMIEDGGNQYVLMQDPLGYASESLAVSYNFYVLSQHFNGDTTFAEFEEILKKYGIEGEYSLIFSLIEKLDDAGFLISKKFLERRYKIESEYINSSVRPCVCAGSSYPDNPQELTLALKEFFNTSDKEEIEGNAESIIIPHIDFRIGEDVHKTYAAGYHAIRNTEADLYVILGTSHYANSDFFMLTQKDFDTPLGTVTTDKKVITEMQKYLGDELTIDDFAHKPEHSIELQAVLLKYYFGDRDFNILPILTGSLHEFIMNGNNPESNPRYNNFLDALKRAISDLGRKAVIISSVDFAHIGRKFGDDYDASPKLQDLKIEDKVLIDALNKTDKSAFLNKIKQDKDKYKICGTAPIYAMLHAFEPGNAKFLNYGQWDESDTNSAVSFASLAYYK